MVKKIIEWHTIADNVTTPSHKRAYIESCKDWLLSISATDDTHDTHDDEVDVGKQSLPVQTAPQFCTNIGLMGEHIYTENEFECFICKTVSNVSDGKIISANPFTRAQYMLLCASCNIE